MDECQLLKRINRLAINIKRDFNKNLSDLPYPRIALYGIYNNIMNKYIVKQDRYFSVSFESFVKLRNKMIYDLAVFIYNSLEMGKKSYGDIEYNISYESDDFKKYHSKLENRIIGGTAALCAISDSCPYKSILEL